MIEDVADKNRPLGWKPMSTAPKDRRILVLHDHNADTYVDPQNPDRLTPYGSWCEISKYPEDFCPVVAEWFNSFWETTDEYGSGFIMPAWWFVADGEGETPVNPVGWFDIPVKGITSDGDEKEFK